VQIAERPICSKAIETIAEKAVFTRICSGGQCSCGVTEATRGGGLLDLEEEVLVVPVAPAPTQHRTVLPLIASTVPKGTVSWQ